MSKLLDKIVFIGSLIAIVGLLGSYTARYIDPNTFVIPSLLGLAYPYLLLSNLLLLLYWIARWKKTALIHVCVLALGIPFFTSYYGTNNNHTDETAHDIAVLSYNIRYFDRYGWNKDDKTKEKLIKYLNGYKGDVVCLQEFPFQNRSSKVSGPVRQLSSYPYRYIQKNMAVFSRYPIINCREIPFSQEYTSSCVYCDIVKEQDTVRIYNIHLESYKLGTKERKFVKDITQGEGHDIQKSPYPLIVCGDFNDTPLSYSYRTISKGLSDSFLEKGRGLGNTYIGEFPSFRIDYILHSPDYQALSYSQEAVTLSDHYPISCKLKKHTPKK